MKMAVPVTEERFKYRHYARAVAYCDIIDWGIDCFFMIISVIFVIIAGYKGSKELVVEKQNMTSQDSLAVLAFISFLVLLGLGYFALRLVASLDLLKATNPELPPAVAAEKCRFCRIFKFISLAFAGMSLTMISGMLSGIIDVLQLIYVLFSLFIIQRYIVELDQAAASSPPVAST